MNSPRTVLVHLNVEVPADDTRTATEIGDAILAAVEVGSDHESVAGLVIAVPLAEDV